MKHEVLEDNGGGLHLIVFDENGNVIYMHSGYEHIVGQLSYDIEELSKGSDVSEWDGCEENIQETYDCMIADSMNVKVIADSDGVYFKRMGAAGLVEFSTPLRSGEWRIIT